MDSGQHAEKPTPIASSLLRVVSSVVFVLVLAAALRMFVFQPYSIPSGSMEETIRVGDVLISEKVSYYFREPAPGDIVTFHDPMLSDSSRTLIKRVIATEGQVVDVRDGAVYVDGVRLDEPYTEGRPSEQLSGSAVTFPYTVPAGSLWVMGDNRTNSQDSRYFGAVSRASVTGRAAFVFWPVGSMRPLAG
ncbi:signal peptidase I [Eggerthellaceae bacterium zg-1084]|uniref:Signal peptidase I n=1 Tax=Berryella wangjianweii TaxID=2734634 RepID=A0A6M8IW08_9ACTN|nr:signal peptidase I [Berryella wangjianweii]NPD31255.1 signal peptidase I [Berryella wangjianweii]NPD32436.1 signal peptidase I [Eggerthellaceae bacterium zg-997]QKF06805.1 signal peptidase I [Berryella wangjianweii]